MVPAAPAPRLLEPRGTYEAQVPKRRRIWELSNNFHCSIIGTCLTTAELRQLLIKIQLPGAHKDTDHELHGRAVLLAGQRDLASKLLQKALDRRHRSAINQFSKARTADELQAHWASAVQRAEIPGAYWAVLTHAHATEALVRQVFGEVHMLSHLVGAANRADIRRLRELEAENAELQEKIARQQGQLRDAVVARDATIASLNDMLGKAIASAQHEPGPAERIDDAERATTAQLIADLRRRLASEIAGRGKGERRLGSLAAERDDERNQRRLLEERERELRQELEAAEASLSAQLQAQGREEPPVSLPGTTLLYIGGRAHQVVWLRMLAERSGAAFLHHDGGLEERSGLLEAQVSRADIVFFPVDCVSHNAVATVKRISRFVGKRYVALRSSGLTSFAAALRSIATAQRPAGAIEASAQQQAL